MNRFLLPTVFYCCAITTVGAVELRTDAERFDISGNETFSDQQLIDALVHNVDFLVAAHPYSDLKDLDDVIRQQLTQGYRNAGFPDAAISVSTTPYAKSIKIEIQEGTCFHQGGISITGAETIDVDRLRRRLTEPYPSEDAIPTISTIDGKQKTRWVDKEGKAKDLERPVWKQGRPTRFDEKLQSDLKERIKKALSDVGYSQAQFHFNLANNPQTQTTQLQLHIDAVGQPDQFAPDVDIEGIVRHSPEDVLKHIGFKPELRVDRELIAQFYERLWSSGRFEDIHIQWEVNDTSGRLQLKIRLKELDLVPLLGQPLNAQAHAFLKARSWFADASLRGDDLVFQYDSPTQNVVAAINAQGVLVKFTDRTDEKPLDVVFVIQDKQLMMYLSSRNAMYHLDSLDGNDVLQVSVGVGASSDADHMWSFLLGNSVSSKNESDNAVIEVVQRISPASFILFAYKENLKHQWDGETLITRRTDSIDSDYIRIDKRTGKCDLHGEFGHITAQAGRFHHELQAIQQSVAKLPNAAAPQRPVSSFIEYCCDPSIIQRISDIAESPSLVPLGGAVRKLASGNVFSPADYWMTGNITHQSKPTKEFNLPLSPNKYAEDHKYDLMMGMMVVAYADKLFDQNSWPRLVAYESGLVLNKEPERTNDVIKEIYSNNRYGPLCLATVSQLTERVSPILAAKLADRGLERLNAEAFERDFRDLMSGAGGRWLHQTLIALQSLETEELEALIAMAMLGEEPEGDLMRRIHKTKTQDDNTQSDIVWFNTFEQPLAEWLKTLSQKR